MMADLPRIAVGSVQRAADDTAIKWALLDCFESVGLRVQCFLSRAHAAKRDGATAITGLPPRHLDSWLMGPRTCRDLLLRGSRTSELAVVEGTFAAEPCGAVAGVGGRLETLCEWLELPALAIVDARQLSPCQLPERPRQLDGILLDGVCDATHACRLQTTFEALWQVPVVGWLTEVSALRKQIDAIPAGGRPDVSLCRALGQQLALHLKLDRILQIARQHTLCDSAQAGCAGGSCWCSDASRPLQVAVACDDAFGGCFPDTLDLLEARGARLSEFSPLRDDRLPHGADVVYIGCGHPEQFAAQLASNDCMHLALKSHLCSGGRLYAECGGLAYLCQQLETADGQRWSMVGVLRATACYQLTNSTPEAVERTLVADTWLGRSPAQWRGYLNPHWTISAADASEPCVAEVGHESDVLHRHRAVGSRLYQDFAAQPERIDRFFQPHRECAAAHLTAAANPRRDPWL